uniref:STARD3 N-terminal like n=1 Tax=Oryzias sinensis TaxID=183150 RepID=A0A8C7WYF5_9TELE
MERSIDSRLTAKGMGSVSSMVASARLESYEAADKKCISDVRRTFCLFVTFDLLFITMLWIIELNVNGSIETQLDKEVLHYDYHASFFDIFLLAVFRFSALILSYAICKLRHWWAIAVSPSVFFLFGNGQSSLFLQKVGLTFLFCHCLSCNQEEIFRKLISKKASEKKGKKRFQSEKCVSTLMKSRTCLQRGL